MYAAEQRVATLSGYFASMAVLISCLGLFGLATFTAERRLKEIGIRKVNGAKIYQIISMLNWSLVKWIALSFALSIPIALRLSMTKAFVRDKGITTALVPPLT